MVQNSAFGLGNDESTPLDRGTRQRDPNFFMSRLAPSTLAALDETQQADVRAVIA